MDRASSQRLLHAYALHQVATAAAHLQYEYSVTSFGLNLRSVPVVTHCGCCLSLTARPTAGPLPLSYRIHSTSTRALSHSRTLALSQSPPPSAAPLPRSLTHPSNSPRLNCSRSNSSSSLSTSSNSSFFAELFALPLPSPSPAPAPSLGSSASALVSLGLASASGGMVPKELDSQSIFLVELRRRPRWQ